MDRRLVYTIASFSLFASVVSFRLTGFPRPWWQFPLLVAPLAVVLVHSLTTPSLSRREGMLALGTVTAAGLWLRVSGYIQLATAGRDTQMWLRSTRNTLASGSVPDGGMYGASPLHIIEMAMGALVYGTDIFGIRYVTIAAVSTLPIVIYAIAWRMTRERRTALVAAILTSAFPLFTRTSPLLESEHAAMTWFATLLLLLVLTATDDDRRPLYLAMSLVMGSAFLHFFYSTLFAVWTASIGLVFIAASCLSGRTFAIGSVQRRVLWIALPAFVLIPFHILWSSWGHQGAAVLVGLLNVSLPMDIMSAFLPSSGAVGESVGSGSNGPWYASVISLGSVGIFLLAAGIGGVLSLRQYRDSTYQVAIVGAGSMIVMAVGITAAGISYNLNFRLFYFIGVFAVIFGAIAAAQLARWSRGRRRETALQAIICGILIIAMVGGPMSPFGNNIDSPLGDERRGLTHAEHSQAEAVHMTAGINDSDVREVRLAELFGGGDGSNSRLVNTGECPRESAVVASTGDYELCSAP